MNDIIRVVVQYPDGREYYVEDDDEPIAFDSLLSENMCVNALQPLYPDVKYYVRIE